MTVVADEEVSGHTASGFSALSLHPRLVSPYHVLALPCHFSCFIHNEVVSCPCGSLRFIFTSEMRSPFK